MNRLIRTYQEADFAALVSLIDSVAAPKRAMTPRSVRELLTEPGSSPCTDLVVAPGTNGRQLDGARDVRLRSRGDEDLLVLESWGGVDPGAAARLADTSGSDASGARPGSWNLSSS